MPKGFNEEVDTVTLNPQIQTNLIFAKTLLIENMIKSEPEARGLKCSR